MAENLLRRVRARRGLGGAAGATGARRHPLRLDRRHRGPRRAGDADPRERAVFVIPLGFAAWSACARRATPHRARARPPAARDGRRRPCCCSCACAMIAPWTIRNAVELHHFVPVSDETGITLVGTYNPTSAASQPVPYKWRPLPQVPEFHLASRRSLHRGRRSATSSRPRPWTTSAPIRSRRWMSPTTTRCGCSSSRASYAWHASADATRHSIHGPRVGVVAFWVLLRCWRSPALFTAAARAAPAVAVGDAGALRALDRVRQRRDAALPRADRPVPDPAGRLRGGAPRLRPR